MFGYQAPIKWKSNAGMTVSHQIYATRVPAFSFRRTQELFNGNKKASHKIRQNFFTVFPHLTDFVSKVENPVRLLLVNSSLMAIGLLPPCSMIMCLTRRGSRSVAPRSELPFSAS